VHARAIGIEDARDLDVEVVLAAIVEEERFGTPLAFVSGCGWTVGSP
jgi:hypothetical protein